MPEKKNLPIPRPDLNESITDVNSLMDRILDDMEPSEIPVEYIYHLATVNTDGDLTILLGHDICDYRYGHARYKGWKTVHYSVNIHKLYLAVAKETTRVWKKAIGHPDFDPFDFDGGEDEY